MMRTKVEAIARKRIAFAQDQIRFSLKKISEGNPFASERNDLRRQRRLQTKVGLAPAAAEALSEQIERYAGMAPTSVDLAERVTERVSFAPEDRRERIWGDTVDFVNVAFLERGAQVARSVGRIAFHNGRGQGTGVLIGGGLLLTNHHVIESPRQASSFVVEFDYERDWAGQQRSATRFELDPTVFVTDEVDGLDFTIVGVGNAVGSERLLAEFGHTGLSDAQDKHMIGEFANIVQHPQGRFKEVVLRENRLVGRFEDALHYVADTEPGSSGSPVYNSEWRMIALHHWGGPWIDGQDATDPSHFKINEGIRVSSIVRKLRKRMRHLARNVRLRVQLALDTGESFPQILMDKPEPSHTELTGHQGSPASTPSVRLDETGRATWTFPVELSLQIPHLAPPATQSPAPPQVLLADSQNATAGEGDEVSDYDGRIGYMPQFLDGFNIPLPELGPSIQDDAATLLDLQAGQHPHELKYHHFSVVINRRRKLAFYTACNIDGTSAKSIGRTSRAVSDLEPTDSGLREAVLGLESAESDSWQHDPRISRDDYSGVEIYERQNVPGFPSPSSSGRIKRMFQKGHLVRRIDPAWGNEPQALEAELDTFHWTNAAPQVGFFNQGRADEDQPGTGNGKLWRAAENFVLRNAVAEKQRVTSFTGPIFSDEDRGYRDIQIPGAFFKLTCWVSDGNLRSLAMIVDQTQVFDSWPEAIFKGAESLSLAEAFQDPDELERVQDFLSTVEELEKLTELDFGDAVRNSDIRRGEKREQVQQSSDLPLDGKRQHSTSGVQPPNLFQKPNGENDDLKRIKGIGEQLERRLNDHGVFHYHQIADWNNDGVEFMDEKLKARGRIRRDNWVGQAKRLMKEPS